jgi:hypothetical protein
MAILRHDACRAHEYAIQQAMVSAIGNAVHEADSEVPLRFIQTMQDTVDSL